MPPDFTNQPVVQAKQPFGRKSKEHESQLQQRRLRDRVLLPPCQDSVATTSLVIGACMQQAPWWACHLTKRCFSNPKDWTPVYFRPGMKPATMGKEQGKNYIGKICALFGRNDPKLLRRPPSPPLCFELCIAMMSNSRWESEAEPFPEKPYMFLSLTSVRLGGVIAQTEHTYDKNTEATDDNVKWTFP
eukprot:XP_017455321.1 PREDICTED: uncharacterized protein LOC103690109 isoform X2 [Rattus norvegicus]